MNQDLFDVYARLPVDVNVLKKTIQGAKDAESIVSAIQGSDLNRSDSEGIADALEALGYPFNTITTVLEEMHKSDIAIKKVLE